MSRLQGKTPVFKVGDWVECLTDDYRSIKKGSHYYIDRVGRTQVYLQGIDYCYPTKVFKLVQESQDEPLSKLKNFYYSTTKDKLISYHYIQNNLYAITKRQNGVYFKGGRGELVEFENIKELIERLDNDMSLQYNTLQ